MLKFNRSIICVLTIAFASALLVGCESMTPASPSASADKAVIAGGTTFVEVNPGQGPPVTVAYATPGKPVCPECEAVAMHYFQTGILDESVCKTCGAHIYVGQSELVQPK